MPLIAAGVSAGASVLGGIFGGKQAKKASKAQTDALGKALDLQKQMFEEGRADLAPWRQAGGQAIGQGLAMLQPGYDYTASPGYQFRLDEGNKAIQNSAAAKGMLMSGGTLKDIDRFSQGLAAGDYNDQFNRLMSVASGGQQAATSTAQLGQNMANAGTNIYNNIGQAKASGYAGVNQAFQGGLSGLVGAFGMSGLGGGGYGGGMGFSDRRLKTNIRKIGEAKDGLGIYEWNWKGDPDGNKVTGVIADEVEKLRPWAFVPNFHGGYAGVNYAALGEL